MNNRIGKFIISLAIGIILLTLTFRYFDLKKTVDIIKGTSIDLLALALLMMVSAYFLRGIRWTIWEPGLKFWDSFKIILVGFMGNNILPARLGEVLRAHCASAKIESNFGRTATLGSIAIERILDGFIIALLGIAGLLLVPLRYNLFWALAIVCIIFFVLTVGLILGNFFHLKIRAWIDKINEIFPGHLTSFGKEKVNFFLDGLLLVRRPSTFLTALSMTCLIWGVELATYYLIAKAVFPETSYKISFVFLSVVNFASLFPFTVGGLGAIEGATGIFLVDAGLPINESMAMVVIQHAFQFLFTTMVGSVFYFTNKYYEIPLVSPSTAKGKGPSEDADSGKQVLHDTRLNLDQLTKDLGIPRKQKSQVDLSIVIPCYNEKDRLPLTVLETIKWCKEFCPDYEIIIVDDGSTDETFEIIKLFSEYDENVKALANPHMGKGAAVRTGMLNASGMHVLFMDADGATPLKEIPKLREKLDNGSAVAIGSRIVLNGETKVVTSMHRKIIGRTFAAIVNIFGVSGIGDTQCGFKMFQGDVVKDVFLRQKLNGFAFDVEILFLSRRLSLEIAEVPVNWNNKEGSKVNLVLDSIKMFRDVLKLKVLHMDL